MNNIIYLTKKLISSVEVEEIDFDFYKEFKVDRENDDEVGFCKVNEEFGSADGYPININRIIHILEILKRKGSTHVAIDYHCDHIGYMIDGYEILKASDNEIVSEIAKKELEKDSEKELLIKQLEERIEFLKNN